MTATLMELPIEDRIQNAVAIFKKQDVAIAAMKTECLAMKIDGIDDKEGYTKVYESRQTAKRLRIAVGKKAKAMKEDALRDGKALAAAITEEDKRITAELETIEDYLQMQEDEYETAKQKIRDDKAAAAQIALQKRIDRLTEARCPLPEITFLRDIDADNFELYFAKAVETQEERERLAQVEADQVAAEQVRLEAATKAEKERVAAETQAELDRQAEANRVESVRLHAESERIKADAAIAQEKIEAERAELKRQADELHAKQEADRLRVEAENAEIARAELEQAEAARLEALKPEIEKAESFSKMVRTYAADVLFGLGNPSWSVPALCEIEEACRAITAIAANQ